MDQWPEWCGMEAKVERCYPLELKVSLGHVVNPHLSVSDHLHKLGISSCSQHVSYGNGPPALQQEA